MFMSQLQHFSFYIYACTFVSGISDQGSSICNDFFMVRIFQMNFKGGFWLHLSEAKAFQSRGRISSFHSTWQNEGCATTPLVGVVGQIMTRNSKPNKRPKGKQCTRRSNNTWVCIYVLFLIAFSKVGSNN